MIEPATYIHQLDKTAPSPTDFVSEGDDHLRLLKSTLQNTFPNVTGAVNATQAEINTLVGASGSIGSQLALKANKGGDTYTGTHNLTGATVTAATQTAGDASDKVATTAFVTAATLTSTLPGQSGNAGKVISTDGTNAGWINPVFPTAGPSSMTLTRDGSGNLTGLSETIDGDTATTTLTRSGGRLSSVATTFRGVTRTQSLSYTGDVLTSITATIS